MLTPPGSRLEILTLNDNEEGFITQVTQHAYTLYGVVPTSDLINLYNFVKLFNSRAADGRTYSNCAAVHGHIGGGKLSKSPTTKNGEAPLPPIM